jgi:hypothetical protein
MLGSNLDRDTGFPEVRVFPQSLHVNSGIVSRLNHCRFLPDLYHGNEYARNSRSIVGRVVFYAVRVASTFFVELLISFAVVG